MQELNQPEINLKYFLEKLPPNKTSKIKISHEYANGTFGIEFETLNLHCDNDECKGVRNFISTQANNVMSLRPQETNVFLNFKCSNCREKTKTYSLFFSFNEENNSIYAKKYGENPSFGSSIPPKIYKLIGGERDLFLTGKKCEDMGMGIGAFVYYRRVIESQKGRIFDEIIRVIEKISPKNEVIEDIVEAKKEIQFTKAVGAIKHALPQTLNINGYNPLTLLHSALSEGVHALDDNACLELAMDIRTVLFEFSEKLENAFKDEVELNNSVSRLANKIGKKTNN